LLAACFFGSLKISLSLALEVLFPFFVLLVFERSRIPELYTFSFFFLLPFSIAPDSDGRTRCHESFPKTKDGEQIEGVELKLGPFMWFHARAYELRLKRIRGHFIYPFSLYLGFHPDSPPTEIVYVGGGGSLCIKRSGSEFQVTPA